MAAEVKIKHDIEGLYRGGLNYYCLVWMLHHHWNEFANLSINQKENAAAAYAKLLDKLRTECDADTPTARTKAENPEAVMAALYAGREAFARLSIPFEQQLKACEVERDQLAEELRPKKGSPSPAKPIVEAIPLPLVPIKDHYDSLYDAVVDLARDARSGVEKLGERISYIGEGKGETRGESPATSYRITSGNRAFAGFESRDKDEDAMGVVFWLEPLNKPYATKTAADVVVFADELHSSCIRLVERDRKVWVDMLQVFATCGLPECAKGMDRHFLLIKAFLEVVKYVGPIYLQDRMVPSKGEKWQDDVPLLYARIFIGKPSVYASYGFLPKTKKGTEPDLKGEMTWAQGYHPMKLPDHEEIKKLRSGHLVKNSYKQCSMANENRLSFYQIMMEFHDHLEGEHYEKYKRVIQFYKSYNTDFVDRLVKINRWFDNMVCEDFRKSWANVCP